LHSGARVEVHLSHHSGATSLSQDGAIAALGSLSVERTDSGVCVVAEDGKIRVDLVEHLFAALAALHADHGVLIEVVGPELPLLDGGCREWLDALLAMGVETGRPGQRVTRCASYAEGTSRYEFEPLDGTELEVWVDYGCSLGQQRASYGGDLEGFREEVAAARTFGFVRDREKLWQAGRARAVDPEKVLVFAEDGSLVFPSRPPGPDELARHKLLDLCGDSFLYGGLPMGRVFAERPGHTQTHAVLRRALSEGVLAPLARAH
jgi:UDP-3-O-[3-hydroxymyristoyl] N-acetylglucosamine deacetylase